MRADKVLIRRKNFYCNSKKFHPTGLYRRAIESGFSHRPDRKIVFIDSTIEQEPMDTLPPA